EAQEDAIRARLAAAPADVPDIHPNISEIYRRKVERLTHALSQPEERQEAADALRALIERIELTPGAKRGEVNAMLYGEFGRILEWIEQRRLAENAQSPGAFASGLCEMSVSVVAGGRSNRDRQNSRMSVSMVAGAGFPRWYNFESRSYTDV
ncbi:hypothetical protein K9B33_22975, partial [Sphingobium sp. 3R8]|nr:hypothetical protein [Sphingobium sp. 3R8]